MLYCEKCKVTVRSKHDRCPLCQGELAGAYEENERIFPVVEAEKTPYPMIHRIIAFAAIAVCVICVAVNWIVTPHYRWSWYVVGATICTWIVVNVGIAKRKNLMKNTLWQLLIIEVLLAAWDGFLGWNRWWVNFFFPIGILLAFVVMLTITIVWKLSSPQYMIYLLAVNVTGCIPIILLLTRAVTTPLPSVICAAVSILSLAAFFIFQRRAVISEIHKKFHI
ncbi:MAG: DUF6320 domain-containing protein [Lachnospiraceae bacterium]|jgi:hypothetical protein|nr:DUF6320 domain-containing protein [Lachnospiraceae bacterium]MDD3615379.1 DUF6320 domain-containing protein [Lachnospiraceae bacterium]